MDIDVIGHLISIYGFPIVACGALFWFVNKQEERRSEEIESMRNTISENTTILTSLKELIQMIIKKDE